MSTAELTKLHKIVIAISALLLAPLAQYAIARGGGGGGGHSGGSSHMGGGGGGRGFSSGSHFSGGGGGGRSFSSSSHFSGGSRGFSGGSRSEGISRQGFSPSRGSGRSSGFESRSFSRGSSQPAFRSDSSRSFNRSSGIEGRSFSRGSGQSFRSDSSRSFNRSSGIEGRSFSRDAGRQSVRGSGDSQRGRFVESSRGGSENRTFSSRGSESRGRSENWRSGERTNRINSDRSFSGNHRGSEFVGSTRNGISRFRDGSSRHAVFNDRDRFHNGFRDRDDFFHGHHGDDFRFHHDFSFFDRHNHFDDFIIWPFFSFPCFYGSGPYWGWSYSYPYYCQRYAFVSLGGYWPDYDYLRYYWYPSHLYGWYGYEPVPQEIGGDTYNNYYTYDSSGQGITAVDESTFADVRARMQQQKPKQPAAQTPADTLFDDGVKDFGSGSYTTAADKFANAMKLSPDDTILPFAYSQSLFALGQYELAASTLRDALAKSTPDKMGVYYPRGLYLDDQTLNGQIDRLAKEVEANPANSDMQLLLGYQQLGMGQTLNAIEHLKSAQTDKNNEAAATMLLTIAEKYQTGTQQ